MKNYLIIISILTYLILVSSCDDNVTSSSIEDKRIDYPIPSSNSASYTQIQNPNNPQNLAGILHNQGLDYLLSQYSTTQTLDTLAYEVIDYLNNHSSNTYDTDIDPTDIIYVLENEDDLIDYAESVNSSSYSVYHISAAMSIYDNYLDYNTAMSALNDIENDIINDTNLGSIEKDGLLACIALGKHSLFYWEIENPQSIINPKNRNPILMGKTGDQLARDDLEGAFYAWSVGLGPALFAGPAGLGIFIGTTVASGALSSAASYLKG